MGIREIVETPPRPVSRLLVSSNPTTGWGALNYFNPGAPDGLADSLNPDADENTPVLPLDTDGIDFPRSASLPLETVREAIAEYCRTGLRPTCVQWQPGKWY